MKNKNKLIFCISSLLCLLLCAYLICCVIRTETKYDEYTYNIEDFGDGVYGIYQSFHSSIPAQNYETIKVIYNGWVHTIKGSIQIFYTDEQPKIIIKDFKSYKSDEAILYVPSDGIEYIQTMIIR